MYNVRQWRTKEIFSIFLLIVACSLTEIKCKEVITNEWLVVLNGGEKAAIDVAKRTGFRYLRPILGSETDFHFINPAVSHMRMKRSVHHTRILKAHPQVVRAVQLSGYKRTKRGYKPKAPLYKINYGDEILKIQENKDSSNDPNDPLYDKQWYLKNTGQAGGKVGLDLNVEKAWAMGYTGVNVTTAVMDDGVDYLHPDLADNYNSEASYDFSSNDPYPYPRYTDTWFNSHGTRCAGEIVAKRDNHICGVGVAYNSKVAGLRMLDQPYMTDAIEANAMGHKPHDIDIYSASWGPTDDGKTVDGPRNMTMQAIVKGVNEGRQKRGNIYVWASGDGGQEDDCNCDGYAASMWTISINSATNDGQTAGYDESCSSTIASTFSNGKSTFRDAGVATTDLYGNCTTTHSGTSAAAPEAAGVFALAIEANRELTWRDMQHLTVLTSKKNKLFDPYGKHNWQRNGAGLEFNHLFGYGVLDAEAMVNLAVTWKPLPERLHCTAGSVTGKKHFGTARSITLRIDTKACRGKHNEVNYLEHVQSFITVKSTFRGNIAIFLTSPMGTKSMILSQRPNDDDSKNGFTRWPFMTTHAWGEAPTGVWELEVTMVPIDGRPDDQGILYEWTLMIHGSRTPPYKSQVSDEENQPKLYTVKRKHEGLLQFKE